MEQRDEDEVADFGKELDSGQSPEIERGGTLAKRTPPGQPKRPDEPPGLTRRPPKGRSHATISSAFLAV